MDEIILGMVRSASTLLMSVLLMFTLARPKYGAKIMVAVLIGVILLDLVSSVLFYQFGSLTNLAKFDIVLFLLIGIASKPFFSDSIPQWIFSYTTVMNFYVAIVVLSFLFSRAFPLPSISNIILRVTMFAVVVVLVSHYLRPLYRQIVDRWNIFLGLIVLILINLLSFFISSADIETTFIENTLPLLLLISLMIVSYVTVFLSFRHFSSEYAIREENVSGRLREELLNSELSSYEDFVAHSKQNRHDIRHHNAVLLEYLEEEDIKGAQDYLREYDTGIKNSTMQTFCENHTANAIIRLYERRSVHEGITFAVNAEMPGDLPLPNPELGIVLSNLLENALEASSEALIARPFISLFAELREGNFLVVVRNSTCSKVTFKDGIPQSQKPGGGTGTCSITRIIEAHGGMVRFSQKQEEFTAEIVVPLELTIV